MVYIMYFLDFMILYKNNLIKVKFIDEDMTFKKN